MASGFPREAASNSTPLAWSERQLDPYPRDDDDVGGRPAEPVRVLVVEDEYLVSSRIDAALTEAGLRVVGIAATARDAVAMAVKERPALAIVDVQLNGPRDGIEVALTLYRDFGIRSLIATAYYDNETVARAKPAAPLGWLPKPYTMESLILKVGSALERM